LTRSVIELKSSAEDRRIARHAAAAIALTVAEAAIPLPLPGIKPGLANIVTLAVLARWGWREAAWVSLLRVFAASLLLGQFLAPGFFLSLGGALASLIALGGAIRLPRRWFGPVSHSILAAFAHIGAQLLIARLWLTPHDGVFYLAPLLGGAAVLFGLVNGFAAAALLRDSQKPDMARPKTDGSESRQDAPSQL
jgi:heptaprenyl diphosphate synthase